MTISTYATLLNAKVIIPSQRTNYYAVQKDHFFDFLRPLIAGILFDEAWYLAAYPDIAEAIAAGVIPSAREHYLQSGYFEHRLPYDTRYTATGTWRSMTMCGPPSRRARSRTGATISCNPASAKAACRIRALR
jgi:hypothetical protein